LPAIQTRRIPQRVCRLGGGRTHSADSFLFFTKKDGELASIFTWLANVLRFGMTDYSSYDKPFPLKRRFLLWIVPGLIVFVGALMFTTFQASQHVVRDIYLKQATQRAAGVAAGVAHSHPDEWDDLINDVKLSEEAIASLSEAFDNERREFKLSKLKVYDLHRLTIFATDPKQMGLVEDNEALRAVIETGQPQVLVDGAGTPDELYELYVPFRVDQHLAMIIEIYEPSSYLNSILGNAALPVILVPGGFLVIMLAALSILVFGAQRTINARTQDVNRLRGRLEGLVSRRAAEAMRRIDAADGILSETVSCTLFYTDIRKFTGYSETHTPAEVIGYLNKAMSLQIEIVERHGGDVDKMIGDALFARFHDEGKENRSIHAALDIQTAMRVQGLKPGIGIGIFSGDVIAGGIGPENRRDYTVIGDSVNVSARLCSMASEGEIVCDTDTLALAGIGGFSESESCHVKGRQEELRIHRFQP